MSHHGGVEPQSHGLPGGRMIWAGVVYLPTALIALLLYRTVGISLVPAILLGFTASLAIAAVAFIMVQGHHRSEH